MKHIIFALLFSGVVFGQAFSQQSEKFDEFEEVPCDDYLGRMDSAFLRAHENPGTVLYILVYGGKERSWSNLKNRVELVLPTPRSQAAKIRSMNQYVKLRKFSIQRVKFIKSGFRENLSLEMWLVPSGAEVPKATPTLAKMRYRKGKAVGFCLDLFA